MDMHQKRKKRQEIKINENKKEVQKQMNINWESTNYLNTSRNY